MYKETNHDVIIRLSDSASIPIDENNTDYQVFLKWLSAGNLPYSADPEPPPTKILSSYKFWMRLTANEQTALENNTLMRVKLILSAWNKAQEINLQDENFIAAINYFVEIGLLTEERKNELLS